MMHVLRSDLRYSVILVVQHGDGRTGTRVATGLVAEFRGRDLTITVAPDELAGVIATLTVAVGAPAGQPDGPPRTEDAA